MHPNPSAPAPLEAAEHMAGRPSMPNGPHSDIAAAAVLVIDVQNDFCHPEGTRAKSGCDTTAVTAMVPNLQQFIAACRQQQIAVRFVHTTHDKYTDSPAWIARRPPYRPVRTSSNRTCQTDTWGSEPYLIAPGQGDLLVTKHRYSAFAGTDLNLLLRAHGKTALLCTGVATDVCVESTIRDALSRDYYITLVDDCCASYTSAAHRATTSVVAAHFGRVMSSDEILSGWTSTAAEH
jgi:ureidoacrylate peracid hydrolase